MLSAEKEVAAVRSLIEVGASWKGYRLFCSLAGCQQALASI